eukprot:1221133-Amphidinium_carterae.1
MHFTALTPTLDLQCTYTVGSKLCPLPTKTPNSSTTAQRRFYFNGIVGKCSSYAKQCSIFKDESFSRMVSHSHKHLNRKSQLEKLLKHCMRLTQYRNK